MSFGTDFIQKIFGKGLRKAKNCKIPVRKRPNYIIKSNFKFGIIFLKLWTLVSNYVAKLSTKVNPHYENIENFRITLIFFSHGEFKCHRLRLLYILEIFFLSLIVLRN